MPGKSPLSGRLPATPPPAATPVAPPAAAPVSAGDPIFAAFAPLARAMSGGDPALPSGRTQQLAHSFAALLGGVTHSGRLVAAQVAGVAAHAPRSRSAPLTWAGYGLGLLGIVAGMYGLTLLLLAVVAWTGDHWTTLQYGDPRTTHLTAGFGFAGETALAPTTITAVTAPGVGHLFVLPGDRADHAFVLDVPLPADPDGRQPLHLSSADLDGDGHPDLLVQPGDGVIYPYLLDTGKQLFRPPTAEEQGRLALGRGR